MKFNYEEKIEAFSFIPLIISFLLIFIFKFNIWTTVFVIASIVLSIAWIFLGPEVIRFLKSRGDL